MKVLVISHMYPSTANEVAGIFVHEQVMALMEKGVEVRVVSPIPWTPFPINHLRSKWRRLSQVPEQTFWDGVPVWYPHYLAFPRGWFFATSGKRMYQGIRKLVKNLYQEFSFDLIHAHVALPDGYASALIARELRLPIIVTIHGQNLQYTVHKGVRYQRILAFVFNSASRIILVSNKLKRLAEQYLGFHDKLVVIPNGVDPTKVVVRGPKSSEDYDKKINLLSVSNLIATKGIDLNLIALERLCKKYPQLHYWVIGEGPLERGLRQLAAKLKLGDRVEFLGRQPHPVVMQYMSECDIFVLPSWNEGFGVVYLEAMAHGKPVIGCQGEGIEDVVEHGKTGLLVKPHDVESLIEALDYLLSHPLEAKAMGEKAREEVLKNYTWQKNVEKILQIYREILNKNEN